MSLMTIGSDEGSRRHRVFNPSLSPRLDVQGSATSAAAKACRQRQRYLTSLSSAPGTIVKRLAVNAWGIYGVLFPINSGLHIRHSDIRKSVHIGNEITYVYPNVVGGLKYPQTDLFTAISEPLGVKRNALTNVPKYGWAIK